MLQSWPDGPSFTFLPSRIYFDQRIAHVDVRMGYKYFNCMFSSLCWWGSHYRLRIIIFFKKNFNPHQRTFLFIFRERRGERKKERERGKKHPSVASWTHPTGGLNPHPRYALRLGIKPVTLIHRMALQPAEPHWQGHNDTFDRRIKGSFCSLRKFTFDHIQVFFRLQPVLICLTTALQKCSLTF